jgi:hypothetical protein
MIETPIRGVEYTKIIVLIIDFMALIYYNTGSSVVFMPKVY